MVTTANSKPITEMRVVGAESLTNEEIWQMAVEDWLGVLAKLWTALSKPLDPEALAVYREQLAGVPLGLLEQAITRVLREHVYNTVPTIGVVWAAVRKELGNPHDIDQALKDWCEVRWESSVYRFPGVTAETAEVSA